MATLDDALLDLLRVRLSVVDLAYAEPPRRLSGGFYTENHVFRLAGAPADWGGPLVLRLFPGPGPSELAFREAMVQNTLVDQGFPTPRVLLWETDTAQLGRSFLVMEFLAGRPMMADTGVGGFLRSAPSFLVRLPRVFAETQSRLHACDAAPLVQALGGELAGVERWVRRLREMIDDRGWTELEEPCHWLVDNRPEPKGRDVICHGDLHPGNLLAVRGKVVALLDWSVATVAEPALDVGFTAMSTTIVPVDLPPSVLGVVLWASAKLTRRYVARYERLTGADLTNQPYYEALRCAVELTMVIDYRRAAVEGRVLDSPRPAWDPVADRMVEYFRARTGVTIRLPAPV